MGRTSSVAVATSAILLFVPRSGVSAEDPEEFIHRIGGESSTAIVAVDLGSSGRARDAAGLRAIMPTLKQLPYLQEITLPFLVDDAALAELQPLSQLRTLRLVGCRVTDAGMKHLLPLGELQTLQLTRTQITDAGLKTVAKLNRLRNLDLSITAVTDKGLAELTPLANLTRLDISYNEGVTDAGIKSVIRLQKLETLWIYGTKLTDAGLKELETLKGLSELRIERTAVTEAGVKKFLQKMPGCKIRSQFGTFSGRQDQRDE